MFSAEIVSSEKPDFLTGGGEMEKLIRAFDWSKTSLGSLESWSPRLKEAVRTCLSSSLPVFLYTGTDFIAIYNDAYIPIAGLRHPNKILGLPAKKGRPEIWPFIEPLLEQVVVTGKSVAKENWLLPIDRMGFVEEYYCTLSYIPIGSPEDKIEGILTTVFNTTAHIIHERQDQTIKDMGATTCKAKNTAEVCRIIAKKLQDNDADIPFALLYLLDAKCHQASLQGATQLEFDTMLSPKTLSVDDAKSIWPLARVIQSNHLETVDVSQWPSLPLGRWNVAPKQAVMLPLMMAGSPSLMGIFIAGVNPRRALDETYCNFYMLMASLISIALMNAQAYEKEQQRIEALAEFDRAKTTFFTDVSHELRTPLTLLLGPLEDALADREHALPSVQTARLQVMQRNALRLLKLTNTLLDFMHIETGRMQGHYEVTDLGKLTIDLVSGFRSIMEKAGLEFKVDIAPLDEPVYVDHDMWEKILFNLLSNAFKYTLQGSVTVSLKKEKEHVELSISDTGVGIPETELPRVFERFYRVKGTSGRSYEGTGIGLALTQELAKLHGGKIQVTSLMGKGSTFIVIIPFGKAHLPSEQICSPQVPEHAPRAMSLAFMEEALGWLPPREKERKEALEVSAPASRTPSSTSLTKLALVTPKDKILFADDNADMRDYIHSLLAPYYDVTTVADGEAALQVALEKQPDLILSDIMMPKLNGFQLIQALRQSPLTKLIPVILLSARAGEEANIEGLAYGAEDYVAKPFAAKELLARVKTHLAVGKARAELKQAIDELQAVNATLAKSEHSYRTLTAISPVGIYRADKEGRIFYVNQRACEIMGRSSETMLGDKWIDGLYPLDKERVLQLWEKIIQTEVEHIKADYRYVRPDGAIVWVTGEAISEKDKRGQCQGHIGTFTDITELKVLEEARLKEAEKYREQLKQLIDTLCHELRNPLNAIYSNLDLLKTVFTTLEQSLLTTGEQEISAALKGQLLSTISEMQEYTSDMDSCAKHQKVILDDVLNLSKLEAHKVELNLKNFNPKKVINKVAAMLKAAFHNKHITLNLKLTCPDELVKGDAGRLKQILLNLLSNAIKFTPEKGQITLSLSVLEQTVDHTVLQFTVEDTGIGMTAIEKGQLFNRFAQASRETFLEYGGSGLGLVISKQLVELMNGKIEVESEKGKGTKFTVTICCQNASQEVGLTSKSKPLPAKLAAEQENVAQMGLHILIAEDNIINQKVLERLLKREGYHCDIAQNGKQAVEMFEKKPFDILLMDVDMPVMDGLEATQAIRQLEKAASWQRRPVPIIGLSGNAPKEYKSGIPLGMNDYMSKPYQRKNLLEKIRHYIQVEAAFSGASPPSAKVQPLDVEEFIVDEKQSEQLGWNCLDVAINLSRDKLCQFALEHKKEISYRRLLAPEIRTAAAITAVVMNQQEEQASEAKKHTTELAELFHLLEIVQQLDEKEHQEEVADSIIRALELPQTRLSSLSSLRQLALPPGMHTQEVRQLVNAYNEAHETIKPDVAICNDLLGYFQGQRLSLTELRNFFAVAENSEKHNAAYQVFDAIQKKFAPYEEALQAYCEREDCYEHYVKDYYGQEQWFAFQPVYAGGKNTSMLDIVAKFLGSQLIVYQLKNVQREEVYRTQEYDAPALHVQYNGAGHFVVLKPNPLYFEAIESILLTTFGFFSTPSQTGLSLGQGKEEAPQSISKTIGQYLR